MTVTCFCGPVGLQIPNCLPPVYQQICKTGGALYVLKICKGTNFAQNAFIYTYMYTKCIYCLNIYVQYINISIFVFIFKYIYMYVSLYGTC